MCEDRDVPTRLDFEVQELRVEVKVRGVEVKSSGVRESEDTIRRACLQWFGSRLGLAISAELPMYLYTIEEEESWVFEFKHEASE